MDAAADPPGPPCPHCGHTPSALVGYTRIAPPTLADVCTRLIRVEEMLEDLTMAVDHHQYRLDALFTRLGQTEHYGLGRRGMERVR